MEDFLLVQPEKWGGVGGGGGGGAHGAGGGGGRSPSVHGQTG